jgi:hypothetical protein
MEADGQPVAEGHVPYPSLFSEIFDKATDKDWPMQTCYGEDCHFVSDMLAYLEELNGRFPVHECGALSYIAALSGLGPVQELVRECHDFLREKFRDEPPHSDGAISADQSHECISLMASTSQSVSIPFCTLSKSIEESFLSQNHFTSILRRKNQ